SPSEGVRAHYNHLAAYVGVEPYGEPHGRWHVVRVMPWAGAIRYVEELGGRWAPNPDYGHSIVRDYLASLLATPAPEESDWRARALAAESRVQELEERLQRIRELVN